MNRAHLQHLHKFANFQIFPFHKSNEIIYLEISNCIFSLKHALYVVPDLVRTIYSTSWATIKVAIQIKQHVFYRCETRN